MCSACSAAGRDRARRRRAAREPARRVLRVVVRVDQVVRAARMIGRRARTRSAASADRLASVSAVRAPRAYRRRRSAARARRQRARLEVVRVRARCSARRPGDCSRARRVSCVRPRRTAPRPPRHTGARARVAARARPRLARRPEPRQRRARRVGVVESPAAAARSVSASPQYAIAKPESAFCRVAEGRRAASSYSKLCSSASPRRNGRCAAAAPEFGKAHRAQALAGVRAGCVFVTPRLLRRNRCDGNQGQGEQRDDDSHGDCRCEE